MTDVAVTERLNALATIATTLLPALGFATADCPQPRPEFAVANVECGDVETAIELTVVDTLAAIRRLVSSSQRESKT